MYCQGGNQMSKLKTTAPSIDQQICPNCGNPFTPVSYFTGVEISASTVQVNATQSVTKTQYSDVTPRIGAYCRYCDSINQKSGGKIGIPIIVIGLIITVIGILDAAEVLRLINSPGTILLILTGIIVVAVGVIRIILGNAASKSKYDKTFTEMRFIQNMKSENNLQPGIVYMPPARVAQLKPESK